MAGKPKQMKETVAPVTGRRTALRTPREELTPAQDFKALAILEQQARILELVEQHSDMNYRQIAELAKKELPDAALSPAQIQAIVDEKIAKARERIASNAESLRAKRVAELDIIRDQTLKIAEATGDYHALDVARKCVESAARLEFVKDEKGSAVTIELKFPGAVTMPALDDGNTVTVTPEPVDQAAGV